MENAIFINILKISVDSKILFSWTSTTLLLHQINQSFHFSKFQPLCQFNNINWVLESFSLTLLHLLGNSLKNAEIIEFFFAKVFISALYYTVGLSPATKK